MLDWFKGFFKFSNLVVAMVIAMNMWFTNRVLDAFVLTQQEPIVLIGAFFGFTGGELWLLASIKKTKIRGDFKVTKRHLKEEQDDINSTSTETI